MGFRSVFAAVTALGISTTASHAALLAQYTFPVTTLPIATQAATTTDPNILAGNIDRGPGIVPAAATTAFLSTGWTTGTTIDPLDYLTVSIGPAAGRVLNLDALRYANSKSSTGPATIDVRSSLDNYASTLMTYSVSGPVGDITVPLGSAFDALHTTVTFRLFGYGSGGAGGTYRLTNSDLGGFNFDGSTTAANTPPSLKTAPTPTVTFGTIVTNGVDFSTTVTATDVDASDVLKFGFGNAPSGVSNLAVTGGGTGSATFTVTGTLDYSTNGTTVNIPYFISDGHDSTQGILSLNVVPEPASLGVVALGALLTRRRR